MRVRWSNYRGFSDTDWVKFAPLTMLVGANNAGKTSLYSPLLLLKQTWEAARRETALLSQGRLFDAGRYSDLVRNHDIDSDVVFSIDLEDAPLDITDTALVESKPSLQPSVMELTFGAGDDRGLKTTLRQFRLLNSSDQVIIGRKKVSSGKYSLGGIIVPTKQRNGNPPDETIAAMTRFRAETPMNFLFDGSGSLLGFREPENLSDAQRAAHQSWSNAGFEAFVVQQAAKNALTRALWNISYVGPLRAMPKRSYQLSSEAPGDVGVEGEFAPEILYRDYSDGQGNLVAAVNSFLERCGYGKIFFRSIPDGDAFSVLVGGKDGSNLVDCGMGLSQILPLVTQVFAARARSLVIVQQPEIHLNPALQVRLMEVFAESIGRGVRVLIETHSEHLLLRLRRLIAEGEISSNLISLMYADAETDGSRVKEIEMSTSGSISKETWPKNFFAEQLEDSMTIAREQARRARAKGRANGEKAAEKGN